MQLIRRARRVLPISVLSLTLAGAFLRFYKLGSKSLWFDEAWIFWISQGSLSEILAENAQINSAPPLFVLLTAAVTQLGRSEAWIRLIPAIAGALAVPAIYFLARRFMEFPGALVATAITAVAPVQIEYSQQVREYSLSVLLSILVLLTFDRFLERPTWQRAAAYSITAGLGLLTQYGLAILLLALQVVFVLHLRSSAGERISLVGRWIVIHLGLGAVVVLVYLTALRYQFTPGGFGAGGHLEGAYWQGESFRSAFEFIYLRTRDIRNISFPGSTYVVLVFVGASVLLLVRKYWGLTVIVLTAFTVVVAASLLSLYPYHGGRQVLFLTPLLYLTVSAGLDYMCAWDPRGVVPLVLAILLMRRAGNTLPTYYGGEGPSSAGGLIAQALDLAQVGDAIYVCKDDPVFRYYLQVRYPSDGTPIVTGVGGQVGAPRAHLDQIDEMMDEFDRAWFVTTRWCGDLTPLLNYVDRKWNLQLMDEGAVDGQLHRVE